MSYEIVLPPHVTNGLAIPPSEGSAQRCTVSPSDTCSGVRGAPEASSKTSCWILAQQIIHCPQLEEARPPPRNTTALSTFHPDLEERASSLETELAQLRDEEKGKFAELEQSSA